MTKRHAKLIQTMRENAETADNEADAEGNEHNRAEEDPQSDGLVSCPVLAMFSHYLIAAP